MQTDDLKATHDHLATEKVRNNALEFLRHLKSNITIIINSFRNIMFRNTPIDVLWRAEIHSFFHLTK